LPSARLRFDLSKRLPPDSKTGWALFVYGDNLTNRQVWMPEWGGNSVDSIPVFRGRSVYFGLEMTLQGE
jgi:outer membrane receptor protein involved in Fe transport